MKPTCCLPLVLSIFGSLCHGTLFAADDLTKFVNPMMGTGNGGCIVPAACVPQGMVQLSPDTRLFGSGYDYDDPVILGFSHVHRCGGGASGFENIMTTPLSEKQIMVNQPEFPQKPLGSKFSHANEALRPGYYRVKLDDFGATVELAATDRCGMQRYTYAKDARPGVLLDLVHGATKACTIVPEDDYDRVKGAYLEIVNETTVRGYRISNGFVPEQQVYFYTRFSKPFKTANIYKEGKLLAGSKQATGTSLRSMFWFDEADTSPLLIKTGISPVDMDGACRNLEAEIKDWDFDAVSTKSAKRWNDELSKITVETSDSKRRSLFYTGIYFAQMYPMLLSDVDQRFRGPDLKVYQGETPYYAGGISIWDTFRAACPLQTILCPKVMNDYVRTFLAFYKIAGQLPINVWWGGETYQMLGLHTLPIIADCYYKGIRDYDASFALEAMKASAMQDTTGYSMRYFVGLKNYKKFGYVPADLEMEATARTLEYAYDDWSLAQMAKMLGKTEDHHFYLKRAASYRNVLDPETHMMRGRMADGSWRTPFDPLASNHRRDDYCEGNAWQWTFFVPQDVRGLAEAMGGNNVLLDKLDTLFTLDTRVHGENASGDISGMIGQYAHGNEPGHHTIYMYSYFGQPWKTQKYAHQVIQTLYDDTPKGMCGNDDTGQMSAWYLMSSMGFYPVRHGDGIYVFGSPSYDKVTIHLSNGKNMVIRTHGLSDKNIYIQSVSLNDVPHGKTYLKHEDLMAGGELVFEMGPEPSAQWGAKPDSWPPSMVDEDKE